MFATAASRRRVSPADGATSAQKAKISSWSFVSGLVASATGLNSAASLSDFSSQSVSSFASSSSYSKRRRLPIVSASRGHRLAALVNVDLAVLQLAAVVARRAEHLAL